MVQWLPFQTSSCNRKQPPSITKGSPCPSALLNLLGVEGSRVE